MTSPIDNEQDHLDHDRVDKMRQALSAGGMDEVRRRLGQDAGGPELAEAQRQQRQARDRLHKQRAALAGQDATDTDRGTGQGKQAQAKQAQERQCQQQRAQASQQATPQKSTETKPMTIGQKAQMQVRQRLAAQRDRQQEKGLSR